MIKHYLITNPIEVNDAARDTDILDANIPSWLKKEFEKVAKIENCNIRELKYTREFYFDTTGIIPKWRDNGDISIEK